MIPALLLQFLFGLGGKAAPQFNNLPGVDIWCGKAYRETNSSFDPGGALTAPPRFEAPRLDLQFYPRMNLYLSTESTASFIVDAPLSYISGSPYTNRTFDPDGQNASLAIPFTTLKIQIQETLTNKVLIPWTKIVVNSTGNDLAFNLRLLDQQIISTIPLRIIASSPDGLQTYQSQTTLTLLPPRTVTGSVSRIDALHGGLYVSSSLSNHTWKPIFPYSFYTSWDWITSTLTNASMTQSLSTYRALGYNIIHAVPPAPYFNLTDGLFEAFLTLCDDLELYVMHDMRHSYQNVSAITLQLAQLTRHPSLLLYYTADEPDGSGDPLNATSIAYSHLKSLDPYHPTSLVLNCQNFWFGEYTHGADIVLEDTYPHVISTSFSPVYNTPCNLTYGDCGCDNCHSGDPAYPMYVANKFLDISERVDDFYTYQTWLAASASSSGSGGSGRGYRGYRKPVWGVPQAFFDANSFWSGFPSRDEEAVMHVLRINHGVKGLVGWIYPTSTEIETVVSELAGVFASEEIAGFLLGTEGVRLSTSGNGAEGLLDATAWVKGGRTLVSVVYVGYEGLEGAVEVRIPLGLGSVEKVVWGAGGWHVGNGTINKKGLRGLEVSVLLLS
ncbi:hypothetical protein BCR34DRAFT_489013 [Clohesyomyces aquaticus]|uniref:Glycoside hydrolase superfamily n=1 Tax=Clohesyomyces aquaticus TaxID=1231657 RepID=A0A1Y1ZCQ1_9PLEO|nr:hypothetical protein BCR34DRAFT_489013 [Clohesyomyces aquaticus]